jgi:hypothetical protein
MYVLSAANKSRAARETNLPLANARRFGKAARSNGDEKQQFHAV